jgi:hypothetical protein
VTFLIRSVLLDRWLRVEASGSTLEPRTTFYPCRRCDCDPVTRSCVRHKASVEAR